ncbi:hypothetical protein WMF30_10165 [Sorangium sp. So ce134]
MTGGADYELGFGGARTVEQRERLGRLLDSRHALWSRDGELRSLPSVIAGSRDSFVSSDPAVAEPWPPGRALTRAERRASARRCSGRGRRAARSVPRRWPKVMPAIETVYRGHRLSDGLVEVLLYLPEGQRVERQHLDDVKRWLARSDQQEAL